MTATLSFLKLNSSGIFQVREEHRILESYCLGSFLHQLAFPTITLANEQPSLLMDYNKHLFLVHQLEWLC